MGLLDDMDIPETEDETYQGEGIERNPWENLLVSLERNTYRILGNVATGIRKAAGLREGGEGVARLGMQTIGEAAGVAEIFWDGKSQAERLLPETDPELLDKFSELLGATAPYMALTLATGGVGAAAAGAVGTSTALGAAVGGGFGAFVAMREDTYKSAIASGATEEQANMEANIVGGINALLEVAQLGRVFRATKTGTVLGKALTTTIRNKAWGKVIESGGKLSMNMIRTAATEGLEEALQGTTEDVVPFILRGKEIEEGFLQRRLGEAAAGGVMGGLFGVMGTMAGVSYEAGKGRVLTVPEIENMEVAEQTSMPVRETDTSAAERPGSVGKTTPAEMSPELSQVADAAQDGQELEAGGKEEIVTPAEQQVAEKVYMKGFAAKLTTIRGNADNMLAGAGNKATQQKVMQNDLQSIVSHYESISDVIEQNKGILPELSQIKQLLPEYKNSVEAFVKAPSKAGFNQIKMVGDKIGELGAAYGSVISTERAKEMSAQPELKQAVQNVIQKRLAVDASPKDRLGSAIKGVNVQGIRKRTAKEMSIEKGKRIAESESIREEILKSTGDPDYAIAVAKKALGGEYAAATFPVDESAMTESDWTDLKIEVHNSKLQPLERLNAYEALESLKEGIIPAPYAARQLEKALKMPGLLNQIVSRGIVKGHPIKSAILETINFPRTLLAGLFDNSFPGRQGITILARHPKIWWRGNAAGYKAMFDVNENWTRQQQVDMQTAKYSDKPGYMDTITDLDGPLVNMEEGFLSRLAKKIPFLGAAVRAGHRAATVSMNRIRTNFYSYYAEAWEGTGKTDQDYKDLSQLALDLTGRGHGKTLAKMAPYLNAALFSPRYVASRFQLIGDVGMGAVEFIKGKGDVKAISPASKIAAANMASFIGAGLGLMGMAAMMGADVERNPESSDFGKIKIGKTRIDIWAGYSQIARLFAQEITGKGKSIRTGERYDKNRLETVGRFIQSKLSPAAGLGVEILSGKDYMGEPIPERVRTPEGAMKYALEKVAPLVFQDTIDALRFQGVGTAAWTFPLAFQGIGVQTYEPRPLDFLTDAKNHYSAKVFQSKWDDLGPVAQTLLKETYPQIVELENKVRMERREIGLTLQEQQDAGWEVQRSLPKEVQTELENINFFVGGLSRRLNRDWRLNQTLYKEYQDKTTELLNLLLPKLISMPGWNNLGDAEKGILLTEFVNKSKESIRQTMVMKANIKDLERLGQ